jgi:hypothetical protein
MLVENRKETFFFMMSHGPYPWDRRRVAGSWHDGAGPYERDFFLYFWLRSVAFVSFYFFLTLEINMMLVIYFHDIF